MVFFPRQESDIKMISDNDREAQQNRTFDWVLTLKSQIHLHTNPGFTVIRSFIPHT